MPYKHKEKDLIKSNSIHEKAINYTNKTHFPYIGVYVSKTCKNEVETINTAYNPGEYQVSRNKSH
jgi:hypothetical protein